MKYIVFLGDGMADEPIADLGNSTPLQKASKPNIDYLAKHGECGMVQSVPNGMAAGSDVANLSMMGYDPREVYSGRAPLEALSIGIDMADFDIAYRCNFVTLSDASEFSSKTMVDYSAGEISTEEAHELIAAIQDELGDGIFKFYGGVSYRNCLIEHNGAVVKLTPPHDILDKTIGEYLPSDERLLDLIKRAHDILINHPINVKRVEEGKNAANSIWLWGAGKKPNLGSFKEMYNLDAAVISAVDLLKGIAIGGGMKIIEVAGATGRLDTDWDGKAEACIQAIKDGADYVYIHMEAADECGHQGDTEGKIKAIEHVDSVVGKVLGELGDIEGGLTVLIVPDHPTPIKTRTHSSDPVPFILYNAAKSFEGVDTYSEEECRATGLIVNSGAELMKRFLAYCEHNIAAIAEDKQNKEAIADDAIILKSEPEMADGVIVSKNEPEIADDAIDSNEIIESDEEPKLDESAEDIVNIEAVEEDEDGAKGFILLSEAGQTETLDSEAIAAEGDVAAEDATQDDVAADSNSDELAAEEDVDKAGKGKKKAKVKKEKEKKQKGEKKVLTKQEKKKRIIIWSIVAVLVVAIIVCSVVIPIVIINKGKIFVSKAEDFANVDKGTYYVLTDDIVVEGNLDIPRPYSIDLNGHNLSVNGILTYAANTDSAKNIQIGMPKKNKTIAEGIVNVGTLNVDTAGNLDIHAVLNADVVNIKAKAANFYTSLKAADALTLSGAEVTAHDDIVFGDNGIATINAVGTLKLMKNAKADFTIVNSKVLTTAETEIKSATLDSESELRVFGTVSGDITGGKLIVMAKGSSAGNIVGAITVWVHDESSANIIIGSGETATVVEHIIELQSPSDLNVVVNADGKILLNIIKVANAVNYEIIIGDDEPFIQTSEGEGKTVQIDITEKITKYIGDVRIQVRALGADGVDTDLVVPSIATVLNYTHEIKLSTPTNVSVTKDVTDSGVAYYLNFDSVNFANKYRIEINGNMIETSETRIDITAYLTKAGSYSIRVQAVNTDNAAILNSEKSLTGYDIYLPYDEPVISAIANDEGVVTLSIGETLAKWIRIEYIDSEGNTVVKEVNSQGSYDLGKIAVGGTVKVTLLANGHYTQIDIVTTILAAQ